ncbi:MAG: ATP-grasp domain-containing protein [Pseudonocardiaceae bacterium]
MSGSASRVVVKPVVGSGSVGVRLCVDGVDVKTAVAAVLDVELAVPNAPRPTTALVEGYLDGPEFSVETFDDRVVGVTAKHLGPAPYFVETGHDFPAPLTPGDEAAIGDVAVYALRALGLGWGAAHTEVRLTSSGPRIVEINPRLAGGMIPQMVAEATGVDLIACVVARAARRAVSPQATRHRAASIRFVMADRSGVLTAIHGVARAERCPGVVGVGVVGVVGEHLEIRRSFRDRIAYVITVADDGESAATAADVGARMIAVEIVPNPADLGAVRRE